MDQVVVKNSQHKTSATFHVGPDMILTREQRIRATLELCPNRNCRCKVIDEEYGEVVSVVDEDGPFLSWKIYPQ